MTTAIIILSIGFILLVIGASIVNTDSKYKSLTPMLALFAGILISNGFKAAYKVTYQQGYEDAKRAFDPSIKPQ